jgi:tripartite-type tricarboxylate transporter receptor subunit TctC
MEHLATRQLRALATGSARRLSVLPDVPTVAESGYPGFEATNWQGMFVAARTPMAIVRKIHRAVVSTLAVPEIRQRLLSAGQEPVGSPPEEFDAKVKSEMVKFKKIVKDAQIVLVIVPHVPNTCASQVCICDMEKVELAKYLHGLALQ